jgi:hypothetical protein
MLSPPMCGTACPAAATVANGAATASVRLVPQLQVATGAAITTVPGTAIASRLQCRDC